LSNSPLISEDWFWECNEERWELPREQRHCFWDRTVGRSGSSSLGLRGDADGQCWFWRIPFCGAHMRPPPHLAKRLRLTAYVKTEALQGRARLSFQLISDPEREVEYAATELSGDNDWTRIELITAPSTGGGNGQITLELEGRGKAWFDDVEVVNLED